MKVTLEIPDAAHPLKRNGRVSCEAMDETRRKAGLYKDLERIDRIFEEEFEKIDPEM